MLNFAAWLKFAGCTVDVNREVGTLSVYSEIVRNSLSAINYAIMGSDGRRKELLCH